MITLDINCYYRKTGFENIEYEFFICSNSKPLATSSDFLNGMHLAKTNLQQLICERIRSGKPLPVSQDLDSMVYNKPKERIQGSFPIKISISLVEDDHVQNNHTYGV